MEDGETTDAGTAGATRTLGTTRFGVVPVTWHAATRIQRRCHIASLDGVLTRLGVELARPVAVEPAQGQARTLVHCDRLAVVLAWDATRGQHVVLTAYPRPLGTRDLARLRVAAGEPRVRTRRDDEDEMDRGE